MKPRSPKSNRKPLVTMHKSEPSVSHGGYTNKMPARQITGEQASFINPYWYDSEKINMKKIRIKKTVKFIGDRNLGRVMNIGSAPSSLQIFNEHFNGQIRDIFQTEGDLDIKLGPACPTDYRRVIINNYFDTVFCFEVLEHLFNPLYCLLKIREVMKDNGKLFVSTPQRPLLLRNKDFHFHEFQDKSLSMLLCRAGFHILRTRRIRWRPISKCLYGVRPMLRLFLDRTILLECEKARLPQVIPRVENA